tara:strand:+ start:2367 stop:2558 length:192 start_codon:yes stop_codon:yes gene_type:complete
MDILIKIAGQLPDWLNAVTALVVGANSITVLTPTKSDDKVVDTILGILNFLSMNFGHNKNKDA